VHASRAAYYLDTLLKELLNEVLRRNTGCVFPLFGRFTLGETTCGDVG